MDWRVIFSLRSQQDLRRIVERIARDNPVTAERFGMELISHAEMLARAPEIGVPMSDRPGARFFPVGPYLIIYRLEPSKRELRILRFWHGARGSRPSR
jgi:plasmid stabilization system protein ParE